MLWPGMRTVLALHTAAVCSLPRAASATPGGAPPPVVDMDLFRAGDGGYACYRLPNLVMLRPAGHMLAIVQGHKWVLQPSQANLPVFIESLLRGHCTMLRTTLPVLGGTHRNTPCARP